ncbi:MAG: hypothetical protein ACI9QL_004453 [Candidatus Omnitrophota bacterium]|jgi:hypothetical protein
MKYWLLLFTLPLSLFADDAELKENFSAYFAAETQMLAERCLAEIETKEDWDAEVDTYRQQLQYMLGLDPMPERTPLQPVITGSHEREGIVVENLHFQSSPGLYVTGNLYRPKTVTDKLPGILYVCGHGRAVKDGISYGNKTHYQHHGAWFARNGYVCLVIDTIQLGEIEGIHHGTYKYKMWWWNTRGYTPAGVEAWNGMRAIDYLQSRPEVDGERIGVTGRSGGGAYSWWIAALDQRVKCAVPVAGITSLKNHVVDGCIEGHCDCMYMVNSHRWDFAQVAALVAPRPLLISNTDKDSIFPLDGVVDVYTKTKRIYDLLGASNKIGLHITEGPHKDTQELRVHAFRWLNRWLKNDDSLITIPAEKLFTLEELRVFDELPKDEIVTKIHESFVKQEKRDSVWPLTKHHYHNGEVGHPFADAQIIDEVDGRYTLRPMTDLLNGLEDKYVTHLRRRHALLGKTLDDVYFSEVSNKLHELAMRDRRVKEVSASGPTAITLLYAFERSTEQGRFESLRISDVPDSLEGGPEHLNLARHHTLEQLKERVASRTKLVIQP